jgi:hypothetical protein
MSADSFVVRFCKDDECRHYWNNLKIEIKDKEVETKKKHKNGKGHIIFMIPSQ